MALGQFCKVIQKVKLFDKVLKIDKEKIINILVSTQIKE
jgi:hypothetical protein